MSKKKKEKKEKHVSTVEKKDLSLRNILAQQLVKKNFNIEEDVFSDRSSSWILIKGDIKVSDEEIFRLDIELSFDADGNELTDINVFKIPFKLTENDSIKIFPV